MSPICWYPTAANKHNNYIITHSKSLRHTTKSSKTNDWMLSTLTKIKQKMLAIKIPTVLPAIGEQHSVGHPHFLTTFEADAVTAGPTPRAQCWQLSLNSCVTAKHTVLPMRTRPPSIPTWPGLRFSGSETQSHPFSNNVLRRLKIYLYEADVFIQLLLTTRVVAECKYNTSDQVEGSSSSTDNLK